MRSHSNDSFEEWSPHRGSSPDELREEVFTLMNKQFDTFRAQVEAVLNGPRT